MSMRTLPLVFINLGGEMLYILDQRLRAHNTSEDNSEKVMNDIVGTMFSKAFMDELLKPQQLYSHRTLKTVLTRLAHASIMRLNPASMDRLYELMVMAFKYQVFLCPRPKDLLLISYNHIDTIREFVKDTPVVVHQVDETHRKIIEVSLFLKNQVQNPNGRFAMSTSGPVPPGTDVPGLISLRHLLSTDNIRECHHLLPVCTGHLTIDDTPNLLAKEELNLLARLMGSMKADNMPNAETGFRINLFTTDQEEVEATFEELTCFSLIQDEQTATELAQIAGLFAEGEERPENPSSNKGDDLLAMMDDL
ncbi:hypothetical protein PAMP_008316 [Pampus punctatissimus]